ncbi:hypothetical protein [Pararhizobium gei]|uniref:hypothetical protein n=1 Tax=Pararhizobium gei TaxID=1395951 RepID=UPI0023DAFA04|nr:hypothetical protein [Rhizobium gei]
MTAETKIKADANRPTVPQHVLDRFESVWQQMRQQAATAPEKPTSAPATQS